LANGYWLLYFLQEEQLLLVQPPQLEPTELLKLEPLLRAKAENFFSTWGD
jgi:hypothetical protein